MVNQNTRPEYRADGNYDYDNDGVGDVKPQEPIMVESVWSSVKTKASDWWNEWGDLIKFSSIIGSVGAVLIGIIYLISLIPPAPPRPYTACNKIADGKGNQQEICNHHNASGALMFTTTGAWQMIPISKPVIQNTNDDSAFWGGVAGGAVGGMLSQPSSSSSSYDDRNSDWGTTRSNNTSVTKPKSSESSSSYGGSSSPTKSSGTSSTSQIKSVGGGGMNRTSTSGRPTSGSRKK